MTDAEDMYIGDNVFISILRKRMETERIIVDSTMWRWKTGESWKKTAALLFGSR